jgi:hypothetical protein
MYNVYKLFIAIDIPLIDGQSSPDGACSSWVIAYPSLVDDQHLLGFLNHPSPATSHLPLIASNLVDAIASPPLRDVVWDIEFVNNGSGIGFHPNASCVNV